ncbi:MAG: hypothetical protein WC877_00915 [Dehalococcoidales bacterium]|jgi:hypothetical protein
MALKRNVQEALDVAYQRASEMIEEQNNLNNLDNIEIRIYEDTTRIFFTSLEENFIGSGVKSSEKTVEMTYATREDRENF